MSAVNVNAKTIVERLSAERAEQAVDVLVDSFYGYPVMRYIVGEVDDEYEGRLRKLMRFFVAARYSRDEPVLVVKENDRAVATAILTPPFQSEPTSMLAKHREAVWKDLGDDARSRYEALGDLWRLFEFPEPHYHLNMIGVLRSYAGRGFGRLLLDAVHQLSSKDPDSNGVSLNTEDERNVPLYEHFGYRIVGHAQATRDIDTWVMFREDDFDQ